MKSGAASETGFVATILLVAGLLVAAPGCSKPPSPTHYTMVSGRVLACRVDTGELTVRGARPREGHNTERTIHCLVTQNSEIYINGKLGSIEDIRLGDVVEIIGRKDRTTKPPRFVVAAAYLDHPVPPPPKPTFVPPPPPTTRPATQPVSSRRASESGRGIGRGATGGRHPSRGARKRAAPLTHMMGETFASREETKR